MIALSTSLAIRGCLSGDIAGDHESLAGDISGDTRPHWRHHMATLLAMDRCRWQPRWRHIASRLVTSVAMRGVAGKTSSADMAVLPVTLLRVTSNSGRVIAASSPASDWQGCQSVPL